MSKNGSASANLWIAYVITKSCVDAALCFLTLLVTVAVAEELTQAAS